FVCSKHTVRDWTRLNCRSTLSLRRTNICRVERERRCGRTFGPLDPPDVIKRVSENAVKRWRINLVGRTGPIRGLLQVIMLILPGCLSIIKRWCIARELKLLHHRVRAAFFSLEQKRHVNLELNKLRRLILIATWSSLVQCLETLLRLCIVLLLKWNLREVVL